MPSFDIVNKVDMQKTKQDGVKLQRGKFRARLNFLTYLTIRKLWFDANTDVQLSAKGGRMKKAVSG